MFPTTSWTLVQRAAGPGARRSALQDLGAIYWPPVYAFLRRQVSDQDEAKDLTQAFFTRLLEKQDLLPSRGHGRFRDYLLACVKHFLSNERDRARAQKRGGSRIPLALNFDGASEGLSRKAVETLTPERIFEKGWAMLMLDRALHTLRHEFAAAGKTQQFDALKRVSHRRRSGGAVPQPRCPPRHERRRGEIRCPPDTASVRRSAARRSRADRGRPGRGGR